MGQEAQPNPIATKRVVYTMPGMDGVTVRRDQEFLTTDSGPLTMDLYHPPDFESGSRLPAVVVVSGYPDPGFQKVVGCQFKDMGWTVSWGRLVAASGLAAIAYTNRDPVSEVRALLQYVRKNAKSLGIDENRLAVLACSGHVPVALSFLMHEARDVKCAVLCYGYMLDLDGFTGVADAAKMIGFVNAGAGTSVEDLPHDLPLFIVRAGQDELPHLNESIDRFLVKALAHNLPVTLVNHHVAPHAFDLLHDSDTSRDIVRSMLEFMRFHLLM